MASVIDSPGSEVENETVHRADKSGIEILAAQVFVVLLAVGGPPFLDVVVEVVVTLAAFDGVDDAHVSEAAPYAEHRILEFPEDGALQKVPHCGGEADLLSFQRDCAAHVDREFFPFARDALREMQFRPVCSCEHIRLSGWSEFYLAAGVILHDRAPEAVGAEGIDSD